MNPKKVVIIGGGFGGLQAARTLGKSNMAVTLIDRRNFHLFQPLLYQVATGGLSPADIASPLRAVLRKHKNIQIYLGNVISIDRKNKVVQTHDTAFPYDYLIVSAGSQNYYFGNDSWEREIPGLKTIEDALEIRKRILYAFEAAEKSKNKEDIKSWLTFTIVGGGPTGVEMAGAIAEIAFHIMRNDFQQINPTDATIYLVESGDELLDNLPKPLPQKAKQALLKMGVTVLTGHRLSGKEGNSLTLTTEGKAISITSNTVIWAAGVRPSGLGKFLADRGDQLDSHNRIFVTPSLQLPHDPSIFVIGDMAHVKNTDGKSLPALAPVAVQEGKYVANLITNNLINHNPNPFVYRDKGSLATIGRHQAVGFWKSFKISGLSAWLLWLFVHLMYLVEFDNRILVLFQWSWNYITKNRGARLIAPETANVSSVTKDSIDTSAR